MPTIAVPANITDKSLVAFFRAWRWDPSPRPPIILDFHGCNFIAPYAVTLFAAYVLWLQKAKRRKPTVRISKTSVAGNFLLQCGFFDLLGIPDSAPTERWEDRTVKLRRVSGSSEIPDFTTHVMDILRIEDEELAGAVKYSLIELLRNVVQHSGSQIGGVAMAQYYPTTGLVEVCVADVGVGIKATIREAYPEIDSHIKALKLATMPHVSRTFGPASYSAMRDNAGLGLFFIKQIASLSGGSFFLGSMDALIDVWGDKEGEQHKIYEQARSGGWPGTFAYVQLRRETIGDFDAVLTTCRKMAAEARKYPAELALDFIDGVPELDELEVVRVRDFEEDVEKAARVRDTIILPNVNAGKMVVLDFEDVKFATQSFVHALLYKIIRDGQQVGSTLSVANCTRSTREAVMAVAAYAKVNPEDE